MVTLPPTDTRPEFVVFSDVPTATLLRLVIQRFLDGDTGDAEVHGLIYAVAGIANIVDRVELTPRPEPVQPQPAVTPNFAQVEEGFYRLDGMYVKVQMNQAGNRTYGKIWLPGDQVWSYEAAKDERVMTRLKPSHKLSAEDAREWGALYGRCIFCSQQLNDERSIAAGYGEVCADNHGLPWGD